MHIGRRAGPGFADRVAQAEERVPLGEEDGPGAPAERPRLGRTRPAGRGVGAPPRRRCAVQDPRRADAVREEKAAFDLGRKTGDLFSTLEAPISVSFCSNQLIFGRVIVPLQVLEVLVFFETCDRLNPNLEVH